MRLEGIVLVIFRPNPYFVHGPYFDGIFVLLPTLKVVLQSYMCSALTFSGRLDLADCIHINGQTCDYKRRAAPIRL